MAQKERTLQDWKTELERALEYQRQFANVNSWRTAEQYYMNKYADDVVSVNLIFAVGRALVPQLYFKTPTILVKPDKKEFTKFAPTVEAVNRKLITQMGMKFQLKLGILDAFISNLAVFKFGYHAAGVALPREESQAQTLGSETLQALREFGDPDLLQNVEQEDQELRQYSYHDWVQPDTPWMLRVRPDDLLVPWGTRDIYSAPWCAFRVIMPLEDVMNNPVYSNKADLKPNATLLDVDSKASTRPPSPNLYKQDGSLSSDNANAVEFYEVWDKRSGKIMAIHLDRDQFMQNEKHNMPIQGLPLEILQFNPTGWNFWGTSDVEQILQQQLEYNETRTMEMRHKKSAILKFFYNKGDIDKSEVAKFMDGDLSAVGVNGNPNAAIAQMAPHMSRDLFNISDIIRTDISEVLGFSRNQAGEFDVSRRTATEAGIVQRALEIRSDERRDQVADLLTAAFQRKINPLIFSQWTQERSIEVGGTGEWVDFTGEQIKGDYNVTVVADSVVPLTQAQRQQAAMTGLQLFRGDPRIDQRRLYEWVLAQFQDTGIPPDILLEEGAAQQAKLQQVMENVAQRGGPANGSSPRT